MNCALFIEINLRRENGRSPIDHVRLTVHSSQGRESLAANDVNLSVLYLKVRLVG
jgi:hypothetical protein